MGPVARMSVYASERALHNAGLIDDPALQSPRA
jgi:hypothetical protein